MDRLDLRLLGQEGSQGGRTLRGQLKMHGKRWNRRRLDSFAEVQTLDECCLIVRRMPNVDYFDHLMPCRHFMGADLCLSLGNTYAIDAPVEHNPMKRVDGELVPKPQGELDCGFFLSAGMIYYKYHDLLPIVTTCARIYEEKGVQRLEI